MNKAIYCIITCYWKQPKYTYIGERCNKLCNGHIIVMEYYVAKKRLKIL